MKKRTAAMALCLLLILSACGSGPESKAAVPSETAETQAETAAETAVSEAAETEAASDEQTETGAAESDKSAEMSEEARRMVLSVPCSDYWYNEAEDAWLAANFYLPEICGADAQAAEKIRSDLTEKIHGQVAALLPEFEENSAQKEHSGGFEFLAQAGEAPACTYSGELLLAEISASEIAFVLQGYAYDGNTSSDLTGLWRYSLESGDCLSTEEEALAGGREIAAEGMSDEGQESAEGPLTDEIAMISLEKGLSLPLEERLADIHMTYGLAELTLTAGEELKDFRLSRVTHDPEDWDMEELGSYFYTERLKSGEALGLYADLGEVMPNLMVSWTRADGQRVQLLIQESGKDGSVFFTPLDMD